MEDKLIYVADGTIKDSGHRRKFKTGAVRDMQKGKGRCDLLPLHEVARVITEADDIMMRGKAGIVISDIAHALDFLKKEDYDNAKGFLYQALADFRTGYNSTPEMILEVSKHFENGAVKYGEDNWQKGIPFDSCINSGIRHFLKCLANYNDEDHYRAFVWNVLVLIWTINHKEILNGKYWTKDYREEETNDNA